MFWVKRSGECHPVLLLKKRVWATSIRVMGRSVKFRVVLGTDRYYWGLFKQRQVRRGDELERL